MSQVDASRFLANLHSLFAPNILDGLEFIAYIDGEPNSLVIQGENILYPSSANAHFGELSYQLENTSNHIKRLQNNADNVEDLCRNIPAFLSKLENVSGNYEGMPDFEFDFFQYDIADFIERLSTLESKINSLEALFSSSNNGSDFNHNANITETLSSMEYKIEALQNTVNDLTAELHSKVISENFFNVSD